MQTLSSASRTCMASASAVECTATVLMPSSLQALRMRSAISPRLAMRILSNMLFHAGEERRKWRSLFDDHEWFAEFDRLAVFDKNLRHRAGARRGDLVHRLHRFDDQKRLADRDLGPDLDERLGARLRRPIGGADHRRGYHAGMLGQVGPGCGRRHR